MTKITSKDIKKIKKHISNKALLLGVVFLIIGIISGCLAYYILCKDDKLELLGESQLTFSVGETATYVEDGFVAISFGKDISSTVEIESDLEKDTSGKYIINTSSEGTYFIKYTFKDYHFNTIIKYRTFTVSEVA